MSLLVRQCDRFCVDSRVFGGDRHKHFELNDYPKAKLYAASARAALGVDNFFRLKKEADNVASFEIAQANTSVKARVQVSGEDLSALRGYTLQLRKSETLKTRLETRGRPSANARPAYTHKSRDVWLKDDEGNEHLAMQWLNDNESVDRVMPLNGIPEDMRRCNWVVVPEALCDAKIVWPHVKGVTSRAACFKTLLVSPAGTYAQFPFRKDNLVSFHRAAAEAVQRRLQELETAVEKTTSAASTPASRHSSSASGNFDDNSDMSETECYTDSGVSHKVRGNPVVKRKPGRPRKKFTDATTEPQVKRKPGRPRKHPAKAPVSVKAPVSAKAPLKGRKRRAPSITSSSDSDNESEGTAGAEEDSVPQEAMEDTAAAEKGAADAPPSPAHKQQSPADEPQVAKARARFQLKKTNKKPRRVLACEQEDSGDDKPRLNWQD